MVVNGGGGDDNNDDDDDNDDNEDNDNDDNHDEDDNDGVVIFVSVPTTVHGRRLGGWRPSRYGDMPCPSNGARKPSL